MDRIRIRGGTPLEGIIPIGGAKNAALPLMTAGMLTDDRLVLSRVPLLADIATMTQLVAQHGCAVEPGGTDADRTLSIGGPITNTEAPYDIVRKMRASILVLGPLLARCGEARVSLPGGCAIGTRPVDLHLKGLEQMGATITLDGGYVNAKAPPRLRGATIVMPFTSVGATENLLMAAALADGHTVLANAAREPEIGDLAECLNAMGAQITGIGTDRLVIEGVPKLHGAHHRIVADRIETGTYACAAVITGGDLRLKGARMAHLGSVAAALIEAGAEISEDGDTLHVRRLDGLRGVDAMTEPYPGFPTDMQAQFMALATQTEGTTIVTENIFENRFMHVQELNRMGANITVNGRSATVRGRSELQSAAVMCSDLRASASLVLAALVADGETILDRVYHLDRGYERFEEKLRGVGAQIRRMGDVFSKR